MDSYVSNKLAGLFESLSTVMAAVCEPTAVDVFLVVSGSGGERPVKRVHAKKKCQIGCGKNKMSLFVQHLFITREYKGTKKKSLCNIKRY